MAVCPCEVCSQRYLGRAVFIYLTTCRGSETFRERFRACQICADWLVSKLDLAAERVTVESTREVSPLDCAICGDTAIGEGSGAIFATGYVPDRVDWYARTCTTHAPLQPRGLLDVLEMTPPGTAGRSSA